MKNDRGVDMWGGGWKIGVNLLTLLNSRVYYCREGSVELRSVELKIVGMVDPLTCGVLPTIPLIPPPPLPTKSWIFCVFFDFLWF